MNLNLQYSEISDLSNGQEEIFFSKISKVLNTCELSKSLMISIYLINDKRLLYCNKVFENSMGYSAQKMIREGWKFWCSLILVDERSKIKKTLADFFEKPFQDVIVLRYHIKNASDKKLCIRHEILKYKINGQPFALNYFFDVSEKEKIENCLKVNGGCKENSFFKNPRTKISSREGEVLKLIADGFSSKQIADKLFISNHTAISHRKHLIEKFKVKNTAQLIKEASKILEL